MSQQLGADGILRELEEADIVSQSLSGGRGKTKASASFQDVLNLAMGFAKFQIKDQVIFPDVFSIVFRTFLPNGGSTRSPGFASFAAGVP